MQELYLKKQPKIDKKMKFWYNEYIKIWEENKNVSNFSITFRYSLFLNKLVTILIKQVLKAEDFPSALFFCVKQI